MAISLQKYSFSAVIFDMDGLLIDTEFYVLNAFTNLCKQMQIEADLRVLHKCIGTNRTETDRILGLELKGVGTVPEFRRKWEAEYRQLTAEKDSLLKEGAIELLQFFKDRQLSVGLATSTGTEHARARLEKENIIHFFDAISGGDQVERSKPAPDIYRMAAEKFNQPPANCLALEDSENGVRAALSAGMRVIQIPDIVKPDASFRKLGHTVLPNLKAVIPHLSSLSCLP